jgi:hypothetical protein
MKNICCDVVGSVPTALLPLPEQERIVAKAKRLLEFFGEVEMPLRNTRLRGQTLMRAVVEGLVA